MGSGPFGRVCGGLPRRRKYASRMSREKRIRFIGDAMEALSDKMSFGRRIWQRKKAHAWVAEVSAKDCSSPSSEPDPHQDRSLANSRSDMVIVSACCQTCSVLYRLKRGHKSGGIGIPPRDHRDMRV